MPIDDKRFQAIFDRALPLPSRSLPAPLWLPSPPAPSASPLSPEDKIERVALRKAAIERAACRALRLAYWRDIEDVYMPHHRLGVFRICESEVAVSAACIAYAEIARDDPELPQILTFAAHKRLVRGDDASLEGYLTYLSDQAPTLLLEAINGELPLYASEEFRRLHSYLLGTTRSGKSDLLKTLIHSYITQPEIAAVVVLDPSGKLVHEVAHWQEFVGNDRLVFFRHSLVPGMVPVINPLEIPGLDPLDTSPSAIKTKRVVAQQFIGAFEETIAGRSGSDITTPMRALLMPCVLTLLDRPHSTMRDLQRFMDDKANDDLVAFGASRTHHQDASAFFHTRFRDDRYKGTKGSISTKLQMLFSLGTFAEITCGRSTIDLEKEINDHKIILFDLSKGTLGDDQSIAFGRLIVAILQGIALRREDAKNKKHAAVHVFIDECHNFITKSIETILLEAGKYQFFMTLCQQSVGYGMHVETRNVVTGMTHVKITGVQSSEHGERTARLFPMPPEQLRTLDVGFFFGRFGGMNAPTVRFHARNDLVGEANSMTEASWGHLLRYQLRSYYRRLAEPEHTTIADPSIPLPLGQRRRKLV